MTDTAGGDSSSPGGLARAGGGLEARVIQGKDPTPVGSLAQVLWHARHVCRVDVESEEGTRPNGTGFLVGPDLVLTNYHVVEFTKNGNVERLPPSRLKCRFDCMNVGTSDVDYGDLVSVEAILPTSPYSASEAAREYTSQSTEHPSEAELDYALLKLVRAVGRELYKTRDGSNPRGWIRLPYSKPETDQGSCVYILQHPGGRAIRHAKGARAERQPATTRVRYLTTTLAGSSGSPSFQFPADRSEQPVIVAIHNYGDPGWGSGNLPEFNHGIPIELIARDLIRAGIELLEPPSSARRASNMAPAQEAHFVERHEEGDRLKEFILQPKSATVCITAALRGAGGFGKTQLARWLAHQEKVVEEFYDGILWVELGEQPKVHELIEGLIRVLTGEAPGLPDATMAAARLKEAIGDHRMLLVIDDVWRRSDLDPFLGGAPSLVRLVTTRFDHVLPTDAAKVSVDAMTQDEAVELLAVGLSRGEGEAARQALLAEVAAARPEFTALAKRLGEWPLLLTLANAQLRAEVEGGGKVAEAIRYAESLYDEVGLDAFDIGSEADRNSAAGKSIGASLKRLDAAKGEVARFEELALFPEDEDIPAATITRLWQSTSGLAPLAGEILLRTLEKWALLLDYDRRKGTVRLHDVKRKYLCDRVRPEGLARQERALVAAYAGSDGSNLEGEERRYYYRYLPHHLHKAGDRAKLDALLMSPQWMQAKLAAVGVPALIGDYRSFARPGVQRLIGQTLGMTGGILTRNERQLVPQLLGRMRADVAEVPGEAAAIEGLLRSARMLLVVPVLVPRRPHLTAPGGPEVRRLEGHSSAVNAVAFSPDGGCVVSGSSDETLRLWDVGSGAMLCQLEGHSGSVKAVVFSPDGGRVVSGSDDETLRLWDVKSEAVRVLGSLGSAVNAVAFSPDGRRLAVGMQYRTQDDDGTSDDYGTLCLWDVESGAVRVLKDDNDGVSAVSFSPDGRQLASASTDQLSLCDMESGVMRVVGRGGGSINAVAFSPDGRRLASGSCWNLVVLWAVEDTAKRGALIGHADWVNAVAFSPDGVRLASGSNDHTVRIWHVEPGTVRPPTRHPSVTAVALSPDGRCLASGYTDETLRLCEVESGAVRVLEGEPEWVRSVAFSPDGRRLASSSIDKPLRLWDVRTGAVRALEDLCDSAKIEGGFWARTERPQRLCKCRGILAGRPLLGLAC